MHWSCLCQKDTFTVSVLCGKQVADRHTHFTKNLVIKLNNEQNLCAVGIQK